MKRHFKRFEVSEPNKKTIQEFIEFKKIQKKNLLSEKTLKSIEETLKKLSHFAKEKNINELTEQELQTFYKSIENENYRSKDTYATNIIQFYRWTFKLHKKTTPPNMEWYTYTSNTTKRKLKDVYAKEKYLITPEEYKKMIDWSNDQYGQTKAIWETLYLSGIRPEELLSMKIKDVTTINGITSIKITDSKTIPREIPLGNKEETPYNLLQYIQNIPHHKTPEDYLWFPLKNTLNNRLLQYNNLKNERFNKMKKEIPLKNTLTLKSFRKTRATIIFNKQIEYNLTVTDIAKIFGWTLQTAILRQQEYLLTDNEELIKKLCIQPYIEPSQRQLKELQSETINKLEEKINTLEKQLNKLNEIPGIHLIQTISETVKENPNLTKNELVQKSVKNWITKIEEEKNKIKNKKQEI